MHRPFFQDLLSLLFPPVCFLCGAEIPPSKASPCVLVCPNCAAGIVPVAKLADRRCAKCGAKMPPAGDPVCRDCRVHSHPFGHSRSLYDYSDPALHELLHRFKFDSNRQAGRDIAAIAARDYDPAELIAGYDVTTAVPVSRATLRERGFNQTTFLLDLLGVRTVPLLSRAEHAAAQRTLSAAERRAAVAGQFPAEKGAKMPAGGGRVLLIDDIYTTGSTAGECARVLLESGAGSVDVLTFFRA